jgi:hypothetical protein
MFVWSDGTAIDGVDAKGNFSPEYPDMFAVHAVNGVLLVGDVQIGAQFDSADYHVLTLGGGNSYGHLYGSYHAFGGRTDGIHLGYNYYADAAGRDLIDRFDGATSRISVGYGDIALAVGAVNHAPTNVMLHVTTSGVCVNGTVNNCSDRNVKQDFAPVSPAQILEKVAQLPISEWSYKVDAATRHIGAMAQDFYSAFNIGTDDKHIAPIDEGGVALAAIQGLNQKLMAELQRRDAENAELRRDMVELKELVSKIATEQNGGAR